jgi:DnaK suppressor protein
MAFEFERKKHLMDRQTLGKIKNLLIERSGRQDGSIQSDLSSIEDEHPESAEIIDIAQALEQMGRDTSLQEAQRRELLAVEKALSKMDTGSFGLCEDCGDEIPSKRLMVLPEARLCAICQAFEEKQNQRSRPNRALAG